MLRNTHFIVGVAATLAVTQPTKLSELILAAGIGGVGALISDIDAEKSIVRNDADKIAMLSGVAILAVFVLDFYFHTNILVQIISNSGYVRLTAGVLFLFGICTFGKRQPHRTFMHSLLALLLFCLAISLIWKKMVPYFAVGFLSHLALDMLNKKKIRILYPRKEGIALYWCHADGWMNRFLFIMGSIAVVWELFLYIQRL